MTAKAPIVIRVRPRSGDYAEAARVAQDMLNAKALRIVWGWAQSGGRTLPPWAIMGLTEEMLDAVLNEIGRSE